jgi:L-threonylcarbamoyladenylate synthase
MRVLPATRAALAEAAAHLARGGVVAIPTETVYGLAGAIDDEAALARIFAAKERPTFDPLIVHVAAARAQVAALIADGIVDGAALSAAARARADALLQAFAPGPLTLVLPRGPRVPDLAASGLPTVAVRAPRHPVAQALLELAGPLAAPSANRFGRISPTSAADVVAELDGRVDLVVDGGPCAVGVESTIVAVGGDGALTLLRPGGVSPEELAAASGAEIARAERDALLAPGMLAGHYAPAKRLILLEDAALPAELPSRVGLLAFDPGLAQRLRERGVEVTAEILPVDLAAAARRLFAALRALDASSAELILAEPPPSARGLGHAILDRLRRASRAMLAAP